MKYKEIRTCEICGANRGLYTNHDECSKIKQEMHKNDKRRRRPAKLNEKDIKFLIDYVEH